MIWRGERGNPCVTKFLLCHVKLQAEDWVSAQFQWFESGKMERNVLGGIRCNFSTFQTVSLTACAFVAKAQGSHVTASGDPSVPASALHDLFHQDIQ